MRFCGQKLEGVINAAEVKGFLVDLARTGCCDSVYLDAVEDSWDLKEPKNIFKNDSDYGVKASVYLTMKFRDKEVKPRMQDNPSVKKFMEKHPTLYMA